MSDELTPMPEGTSDQQIVPAAPIIEEPEVPTEAVAPESQETPKEGESEDQATLQKRLKGAITKVEEANADLARAVEVQAALVQKKPELIHEIAEADPRMANRIIEKTWGEDLGIKTYKQLQERIKLEELKEANPDAYESKKEVAELKERLEVREEKEKRMLQAKLCEEHGIKNNSYDPTFAKIEEALKSLNPSIVAEDYEKAWRMAHTLASAGKQHAQVPEPASIQYGSGRPAEIPTGKAPVSEQTTWLAESLRKRGYKMSGI